MAQLKEPDGKPPQSLEQLIADQNRAKEVNAIASNMLLYLATEMTRAPPTPKSIAKAACLMATVAVATVQATAGSKTSEALLKDLQEFAGRRQ